MGLSASVPSLLFRLFAIGGSPRRLTYSGCNDALSWPRGERRPSIPGISNLGSAVPPRRAEKVPLMRSHLQSPMSLPTPTGIMV